MKYQKPSYNVELKRIVNKIISLSERTIIPFQEQHPTMIDEIGLDQATLELRKSLDQEDNHQWLLLDRTGARVCRQFNVTPEKLFVDIEKKLMDYIFNAEETNETNSAVTQH